MQILKFSLGQLQANCYFLIDGEVCLIIDPADEAWFILEELQRRKLKPVGMLATHGHFDHVMAAGEIQISSAVETSRRGVSTSLYLHKNDLFLIKRLNETAKYFLGYNPHIFKPTSINQLIEVNNKVETFEFKTLKTPGHTPGSVSFYFSHFAKASRGKPQGAVFTGDTLFKGGIGRFDFSYSDKKELKKSLEKLLKLPDDTIVYPGHGEETTIKSEQNILKMFSL